jgi:integrase
VADYTRDFLNYNQVPRVRKAQAIDYKRHLGIVAERLGNIPMAQLSPMDVRGLQVELLGRGLSPKYVKNIISGSLRAMIGQALDDRVPAADPFPRRMRWPKWRPPGADPFTPEERMRILDHFARKQFGMRPGPGSTRTRLAPHPAYHGYVHLLFWTGMRPSEAAGLQWGDVDLERARLHVQRSRYLYAEAPTKTAAAERYVELFPSTVEVLHALQPLHIVPTTPVFTTTEGDHIEPKSFSIWHWHRALRSLGIRPRGIYCCKDTFVTTALQAGVRIAWLEQQTGVSYATLRRHYGKWFPVEGMSELDRFGDLAPGMFGRADRGGIVPRQNEWRDKRRQHRDIVSDSECRGGDSNPYTLTGWRF